jgi:WD40 repeat protein
MSHRPPCISWAEKLALRYEDLSPAERADLEAHVQTCPACEAAQADYHFLDARLRALPPPAMKPLPRLPLPMVGREAAARPPETPSQDEQTSDAGAAAEHAPATLQQAPRKRAAPSLLTKALSGVLIASVLTLLLLFGTRLINTAAIYPPGTTLFSYTRHTAFVGAVAWSPDGKYIASGSWDHSVQVWNTQTGALLFSYDQGDIVDAVAWSPDGKYIASGSWDDTVQVWNVQAQTLVRIYIGHSDFVSSLAWSPDGKYIASGSWDHTVQVWNAKTGARLFTFPYDEIVNTVAWSPDGRSLAVGGGAGLVQVLNAKTGTLVFTYYGQIDTVVNTIAWSPDSQEIASGDRNDLVMVWAAATGKPITTYSGHTGEVVALAWSPNGKYIASGSWDHTVQVWNATTGVLAVIHRGHSDNVAALAWSPNGRYIASGGWDDTVQVWQALSS